MVLAVEKPVRLAHLHVGAGIEVDLADGADDAVRVKESRSNLDAHVLRLKVDPAACTPRPVPPVVVPLAEEGVITAGEASRVEVRAAVVTSEASSMQRSRVLLLVLVDVVEVLLRDAGVALCTIV